MNNSVVFDGSHYDSFDVVDELTGFLLDDSIAIVYNQINQDSLTGISGLNDTPDSDISSAVIDQLTGFLPNAGATAQFIANYILSSTYKALARTYDPNSVQDIREIIEFNYKLANTDLPRINLGPIDDPIDPIAIVYNQINQDSIIGSSELNNTPDPDVGSDTILNGIGIPN